MGNVKPVGSICFWEICQDISEWKYKSMNLFYVFPIQQGQKFVNPI